MDATATLNRPAQDIRSSFLKLLHEQEAYDLPAMGRSEMISEIASHPMRDERSGDRLFAWDIRMNFSFNKTGHMTGGEEVSDALDNRWNELMREDPGLLRQACDQAIKPYFASGFQILGEPGMDCDLEVRGDSGGWLVMSGFSGKPMVFAKDETVEQSIEQLSDTDLSHLWAALRVMNEDTAPEMRAFEVSWILNEMRAELEEEWLAEAEPELDF